MTVGQDEREIAERADQTGQRMKEWFQSNRLQLNEGKTQNILFYTKRNADASASATFLGVQLDSALSFSVHTQSLAKRLSRAIFCIRRIRMMATYQAARLVYFATFHSHLTYGLLVWGCSDITSIFLLQKRALRTLTGAKKRDHCKILFKDHNILTLPSLYILTVLTYMYNNVVDYSRNNDTHDYNTRQKNDLRIPKCRLKKTQQSTNYWGVRFFNMVSSPTKALPEAQFKKTIREHLVSAAYYSIEEFIQDAPNL